nr:hypothetical protein [Thalassobius vesicularis]
MSDEEGSAWKVPILNFAPFFKLEGLYILDAVNYAAAQLDETRAIPDPAPSLKCPRTDFPAGGQFDLVQTSFAHFRLLSNDPNGRETTNA